MRVRVRVRERVKGEGEGESGGEGEGYAGRGHPQVDDAQSCLRGDDRPDGGAAWAVVANHKFLQWGRQ